MNNKSLLSLVCIITSLLFSTAYALSIDDGTVMKKDEVLAIKGEHYVYTTFYCKSDNCVAVNGDANIVEIPNENGNKIKYIANACTAEKIGLGKCSALNKCNADSDCLSNKCIDNYCAFNEENPIETCVNIYDINTITGSMSNHMNCGKSFGEKCSINGECASLNCYETCQESKQPSESDYIGIDITRFVLIFVFGILIIIIICVCIYCLCSRNKKTKKMEKAIDV